MFSLCKEVFAAKISRYFVVIAIRFIETISITIIRSIFVQYLQKQPKNKSLTSM